MPNKPTLSATVNGSEIVVSGDNYGRLTTIIVWHQFTGPYKEVQPSGGYISATFGTWGEGQYTAQAWQEKGPEGSHQWEQRPSAETTFSVG